MPETILLVDDDKLHLEIYGMMLRNAGYNVVLAERGEDAVGIVAEEKDLSAVVLDLIMPGMNGIEAMDEILRKNHQIPIVFHSVLSYREACSGYRVLSADGYVVKKSDSRELLNTLGGAIASRKRIMQLFNHGDC